MKATRLTTTLAGFLVAGMASVYAADLHVPAEYPNIQAAVDAAFEGDTIHITPGVYVEQVSIGKNLTLQGQPGTILRAFPGMVSILDGWSPVVFAGQHLSNVIIRDLTFEGDQLAEQQISSMFGVMYLDSGGEVANCRFTGFRGPHGLSGEVTNATALAVWNDLTNAPLYDLRIADNTIVDSYHGVSVFGTPNPNEVSLNATIENNVIRGIGPTEASTGGSPFSGMALGRGVNGTVVGNTLSEFSYSGSGAGFPYYFGMVVSSSTFPDFLPLAPFRFEDNNFHDNDLHLMVLKSDNSEILNNRFDGTGVADWRAGVVFSGTDVTVQGNKFLNMPQGITAFGDDPVFGLIPGIATNAVISNNRFCNVETNIWVQPLATATVTGTLICPEPELDIASAVLLSWPGVEEGFVVECGPTPNGPWTNVTATSFLQDGSHAVAVPTDGEQQFFRLTKP